METRRPLRIIHCFRAPVGGIFRHVRDLVDAQLAAGHHVGMICDANSGGEFENDLLDSMRDKLALGLERVAMQRQIGLGDALTSFHTYRIIKRLRPDVLHGHGAKGGAHARFFGSLLRLSRCRVARFYSPHGGSLHFDPKTMHGRIVFRLERFMESLTDRIVFVSAFERDTYIRKVGMPQCGNVLIYNGLAVSEFEPVCPNEQADDFLFIGEMRKLKGSDLFVDAVAKAGKLLGRELTATMVGDGPDRAALVGLANKPGMGRITFSRPMRARDAFRLARIVVIPSRAEALPYIALEALAAGRPTIATRVGGIPEIFGMASPALVEPEVHSLAARMAEAIADLAGFRQFLPDSTEMKRKFSIEAMAALIEKEYYATL